MQDWKSTGMFNVAVAPVRLSALLSNAPSTVPPTFTQTWTAYASGGAGPLEYKFFRYDVGADTWSVLRDWSTSNQATWTPGTANSGWHSLQVWVRSVGANVTWEDWRASDTFLVTASGGLTLMANRSLNGRGRRPGHVDSERRGRLRPLECQFIAFDGTAWRLLQGYNAQNTFSWCRRPAPAPSGLDSSSRFARLLGTLFGVRLFPRKPLTPFRQDAVSRFEGGVSGRRLH
jgi:hypothetical protein